MSLPRYLPDELRWFERQRRPGPESEDDPPPLQEGDLRVHVFLSGPKECEVLRTQWNPATPSGPAHWKAIVRLWGAAGAYYMGLDAWALEPSERC